MKSNILSITLITLLALSTSAPASTDVYKLVPPEGSTAMNYTKGAYNTVGTLKVTADDTFDSEMKVDVTVQYDGKFTNTSDSTTVAYNLVKGPAESYTVLNSGDVITFTASSIDAKTEVTIGVVMTGGIDPNEDVSDGDYRSNIAFKASRGASVHVRDPVHVRDVEQCAADVGSPHSRPYQQAGFARYAECCRRHNEVQRGQIGISQLWNSLLER